MNFPTEVIVTHQHDLPFALDIFSVSIGAIFGATLATAKKAPLIGVLIISVFMGMGGSILRDILLNAPLNSLVHPQYIISALICTLVGAVAGHWLLKPRWLILMMDTVVMGLFVVLGTEKAFLFGMPPMSAVFIGMITAIGGGIVSDLLLGQKPDIMSRGPWNASIALVGAFWFVFAANVSTLKFAEITTISLCVFIRAMVLWRGWEAPMPEHLTSTEWIKKAIR